MKKKKIKDKLRKSYKVFKSLMAGDKKNNLISYRRKRAIGEFITYDKAVKKANSDYEKLKTGEISTKSRKARRIVRRYRAANTPMKFGDERKLFNKRNKKLNQGIILGTSVLPVPGATLVGIGLAAANANRRHPLDTRYKYMKKRGYL